MMDPLESHLVGQTSQRPSFWHEVRASAVIEQLPVARSVVVADVGAGAGLLGDVVQRDRPMCSYRFYEPLDTLADRLVRRYGDDARMRDATAVGDADVVTLLDVLEHIEDDRGFLAGLVSSMRPGAILVLTVPALSFLWSPWDERLGHYRRYSRPALRAVANGLPLSVDELSYLFPELLVPALVRRVTRGRGRTDGDEHAADFPELPRALDRSLRAISGQTYRARHLWPLGTSLLLVAHRD